MLFLGAYEMLLRLKGSSTNAFAPMLATAWNVSPDQAAYTFHLVPNARFHDGTVCDAQAVKDSFTRFLQMGQGPVNVIARFVTDPKQMQVVDPSTLRFNLGRSEPLFLAAMASEYGPLVVNPKLVAAHKSGDDPYAHEWFSQNMSGTGPHRLVDNEPNSQVTLARFDDYHGGWAGSHFDRVVMRVVEEEATRRELLESGEADAAAFSLSPDDVATLQANPQLQVLIYDSTARRAGSRPRHARRLHFGRRAGGRKADVHRRPTLVAQLQRSLEHAGAQFHGGDDRQRRQSRRLGQ
jgi:peptide/nickel transport system substrate-binding protein